MTAAGRTGTRATAVLGTVTLGAMALLVFMGLVVTPPDEVQLDAVRLLYVHVPTAWVSMYLSFGVTTIASALYLWRRTRSRFWDIVAGASAEIGVLFLGLTLVVGAIWGRTTWGVYWTWDARLTTTAMLFVLYVGYLAVRKVQLDAERRSVIAGVVALGASLAVPLVHFSVEWWRTLHQEASVASPRRLGDPQITGSMGWTLLLGVVAFTLLYAWLLLHRFRLGWLEERLEDRGLELALAERRAEGQLETAAGRP